MHDIQMPDGTRFTMTADHGIVRLTRETQWSSSTWTIDAVSARLLSDYLGDLAEQLGE